MVTGIGGGDDAMEHRRTVSPKRKRPAWGNETHFEPTYFAR